MNRLDPLNNYLEQQAPKQRLILYVAFSIFVLAMGYLLVLSDMFTELEDKYSELNQKQLQLKKMQVTTSQSKIVGTKKNIDNIQKKIEDKKVEQSQSVTSEDLPEFAIDDGTFAVFLENILTKSKLSNINVQNIFIDSKKLPYIGVLEIQKTININGYGKFMDILSLIRFTENQKFLIKLKSLSIKKPIKPTKDENVQKDDTFKDEKLDPFDVLFDATFEAIGLGNI